MSDMRRLLFDPVLSLKIYLQRLAIFISIVLLILLVSPTYTGSSLNQVSEKWRRYILTDVASYRTEFVEYDFLGLIILVGFLLAAYNWSYVLGITRNRIHTWNVLTNQKHKYEYINNGDETDEPMMFLFGLIFIFSVHWSGMIVGCYLLPISDFDDLRLLWVSYVASASWSFWEGDETFKIIKFPIACFGYYSFFKLSTKLADISNSRESCTDVHMPFSFAGLWGCCLSGAGRLTVRPKYEDVNNFQNDDDYDAPIGVKAKGRWGYVSPFDGRSGYMRQWSIIEPKYGCAERFIDGLAKVGLNGRSGFVDKNKNEYWDMNEDEARQIKRSSSEARAGL